MKALIIGGGIGGLTAGIALRQVGIAVELYERTPVLGAVGAGITLWANALKALEAIGLADEIRAYALPELNGAIRKSSGETLVALTPAELAENVSAPSVALHRAKLLDILIDRYGRNDIQLGAQCSGFSQDASGVTVRFQDGREAHGDLLIGADGLHSAIRSQLHGNTPPRYAGYTAWRAVVPFDYSQLLMGESWGRGARFGNVAIGNGLVYWFATANTPEGQRNPGGEKAELLRRFGSWHAPIPALIAAAEEQNILRNDIYDRPPLTRWGEGRVTLLGDSAHPMTPNMGQGACQAIEDAIVLAQTLRDTPEPIAALRRYEQARMARTRQVVRQSHLIGAVGQWQNPLAVTLRDWLLSHAPSSAREQQMAKVVGYSVGAL